MQSGYGSEPLDQPSVWQQRKRLTTFRTLGNFQCGLHDFCPTFASTNPESIYSFCQEAKNVPLGSLGTTEAGTAGSVSAYQMRLE